MIDASRSPRPAWKRFTTMAVLAGLILVALVMVWKKELHHSGPGGAASTPPAATSTVPRARPASKPGAAPGGVPVSNRSPFQG